MATEQSGMWIVVFAKYPEPGLVNTRLCPPLSPEQTAEIHLACARHVLTRAHRSAANRVILAAAPDDRVDAFRRLVGEDVECWPQGGGDLGERLARVSKRAFMSGAGSVIFLGTDSPMMRWPLLDDLPRVLRDADASMGPCEDGGYYYLALAAYRPQLVDGIDWGTADVAEQTRCRARSAGISLHENEMGYDIDRIDDLRRALVDLEERDRDCDLVKAIHRVLSECDGEHD